MRIRKIKIFLSLLLTFLCLSCFVNVSAATHGIIKTQQAQAEKDETQETIVPSPRDIKEAVAIYVFLGWMWLSIFVLIYILQQKIKEVDRIYKLRFFSSKKHVP